MEVYLTQVKFRSKKSSIRSMIQLSKLTSALKDQKESDITSLEDIYSDRGMLKAACAKLF